MSKGVKMNVLPEHKSGTRLYRCWSDMKARCTNKNKAFYKWYGGAGISFCEEWSQYENFYLWALSSGYSANLTLDRIDNSKSYSPANCRWVTKNQQSRNKSTVPEFSYGCFKGNLKDWEPALCIKRATMWARMRKGKSFEEALMFNQQRS